MSQCTLELRIYDGRRQLFPLPAMFLVTILDGNQKQLYRAYIQSNDQEFSLPFSNNWVDNFTVVVFAEGYKQAGFTPVKVTDQFTTILDIMLIPNDPGFSFVNARWGQASHQYPVLAKGAENAAAEARYEDLLDKQEKSLACLLNLFEAMSQIQLQKGSPLDYIKQIRWEPEWAPRQDRLFAWCDPALITQVRIATAERIFAPEFDPGFFHGGATSSWKQIQLGEANVQLTFHENDRMTIDGVDCIMVEPDIDYFKDQGAHAIFEVIPNSLTHSLTEPVEVYVLRWMAGRRAGKPEFAPMYSITS
jgi:hypothetical protein